MMMIIAFCIIIIIIITKRAKVTVLMVFFSPPKIQSSTSEKMNKLSRFAKAYRREVFQVIFWRSRRTEEKKGTKLRGDAIENERENALFIQHEDNSRRSRASTMTMAVVVVMVVVVAFKTCLRPAQAKGNMASCLPPTFQQLSQSASSISKVFMTA